MRPLFMTLATTLTTALGLSAAPAAQAAPIELLVPAYFYPGFAGSAWDQMTAAAAAGTPITAIMNPGSGPGTAANSDYVTAINTFRAAGGRVLGYVPSGYLGQNVNPTSTCQPASGSTYSVGDVLACASRYKDWYSVDGIFVDEFTNVDTPAALGFYEALYSGLKGIDSGWNVVGNPGTPTTESYINHGGVRSADTVVTFENRIGYPGYVPSPWNALYPASNFAHLLYNVPTAAEMLSAIALAQARNAGYIFVTDDQGLDLNPWDTLPAYWDLETAAIRAANAATPVSEPGSLALMGLALAGLFTRRKKSGG